MTELPFLNESDQHHIARLLRANPDKANAAFVTFATALGKDLSKDYRGANLQGYSLRGQDMSKVDLTGADLRFADLVGTTFPEQSRCLIEGALLDDEGNKAKQDPARAWLVRWAMSIDLRDRMKLINEIPRMLRSRSSDWTVGEVEKARSFLDIAQMKRWPEESVLEQELAIELGRQGSDSSESEGAGEAPSRRVTIWRDETNRTKEIGVTLGTSQTCIYLPGHGIAIREPTVVARTASRTINEEDVAVGEAALKLFQDSGPGGDIELVYPVRDGAIASQRSAVYLARTLIEEAIGTREFRERLHISTAFPTGATSVERKVLLDVMKEAGASKAAGIDSSMAAAIGADLPVTEATGSMIVNIASATTDAMVISMRSQIVERSLKVGTDDFVNAISSYISRHFNLTLDRSLALEIFQTYATAYFLADGEGERFLIEGVHTYDANLKEITIHQGHVREAIYEPLDQIIECIRVVLEKTPPELAADIVDGGIVLVGAGAMLPGLEEYIREETGLHALVSAEAESATSLGVGETLESEGIYDSLFATS